jgi:hypothetical protein
MMTQAKTRLVDSWTWTWFAWDGWSSKGSLVRAESGVLEEAIIHTSISLASLSSPKGGDERQDNNYDAGGE